MVYQFEGGDCRNSVIWALPNPGYEDIFDENTLFAISNVQLMLGVQETDGRGHAELQAFLFSDAALALAIQS